MMKRQGWSPLAVIGACVVAPIAAAVLHAQQATQWTATREALPMPEQPVSGIVSMRTSPSGILYVAIFGKPTLLVYDPAGKLMKTIGRVGKGPGEFQMIDNYGILADTLWVTDPQQRRLTLMTLDGKVLATPMFGWLIPTDSQSRRSLMDVAALIPGNAALAEDPTIGHYGNSMHTIETRLVRIDRAVFEKGGVPRVLDTLLTAKSPRAGLIMPGEGGKFLTIESQPWEDEDLMAISSVGNAAASLIRVPTDVAKPMYTITVAGSGGRIWRRSIPYNPNPITDAMVDAAFEKIHADPSVKRMWSSDFALRHAFNDSLYRPAHVPAVDALQIGNDTTVWVRRVRLVENAKSVWDVFDAKGRQIGTVQLPAEFKVMAVSRAMVWGTEPGPDGEAAVVRYKVGPGTR